MQRLVGMFLILFSFQAIAGLEKAPPAISVGRDGEKAVFVDFSRAEYEIVYDIAAGSAWAQSTIWFENKEVGYPIFDLVSEPQSLTVDGVSTTAPLYTIPGATKLRYANQLLQPGKHSMSMRHQLSRNVVFSGAQVKSAFWTSDLDDREFLEQYLPTNMEFDQYKMSLKVVVRGSSTEHEIFTNGEAKVSASNEWLIEFPEYFNASSIFFHLTPSSAFRQVNFNYRSIDGREIPVTIYSTQSLSSFESRTKSTLAELENDYGAFPHQKVVIYGAGSGGMEYCGATMTSLWALSHELTHSYFARGVMPAAGNAGWIDEAIASWRDADYRQSSLSSLSPSQMAGHSVYTRMTDDDAYSKGERFMGYLDRLFTAQGGLKKFLRDLVEKRLFKPMLNEEFKQDLELYFNHSLDNEFSKYIMGKKGDKFDYEVANPYHPKLTPSQLLKLL